MYAAGTERPVKCAKGALYIQIFVEIFIFINGVCEGRGQQKNKREKCVV
jgi:hypothetical protein